MSIKLNSIAASVLALTSFGVSAQATLYGGGATLPANAYVGGSFYNAAAPANSSRQSTATRAANPAFEGTIFGEVAQRGFGQSQVQGISYCQTGSGTGRNAIIGTTAAGVPVLASGTCGTFAGTPTGFGAPAAISEPDFAGSDAPLSDVEFARGLTNKGATHGQIVQFPVIAAAIAVTFNNADVPAATTLNLTTQQVCGIFNGTINNWNQISASYPAKAIRVVYRSDSSGTTFSFTNWLSANCPRSNGYSTQSLFTAAISPLPAGSIAASGNPGVANSAAATDGAIGYTEVSDTLLRAPTLRFTSINGRAPTSLTAPTISILADRALGANDSNGRPTLLTLTNVADAGCVLLADPNSYATPANNYPIIGISYLLAYNTANRLPAAVSRLLVAPYNATIRNNTNDAPSDSVRAGSGYAYLSGNLTRTINGCVN